MADFQIGLVEAVVLCYTAIALFLSLYFVPFKVVPRAWAKAVKTEGHPAKIALDDVLDRAVAKIKLPEPDLTKLAIKVDLADAFKSEEFQQALTTGFRSNIGRLTLAANANEAGVLTPEQKAELDRVAANPEGKAQLVFAEQAIDAAVANKWLKAGTGKAVKKQLQLAFETGRPLEEILEPYKGLIDRLGGGAPSVRVVDGGGKGAGPI